MEVTLGPNSFEEPSIQYKLQRKLKVFNTANPLPNRGYNLVSCSSKYGLVFVGSPDGYLSVYYLKQLVDKECEPQHFTVQLQEKPTHVAVNCDQELLVVTGGQLLTIYKVTDFQNQNVAPSLTLKCEVSPSTFVSGLQWNPCIPDTIGLTYFDGTLLVSQVSTSQIKKVPSKARCLCWSPKGKQLVTGNNDGTLSQYKPDLTPAKTYPAPNQFEGSQLGEAIAIHWISTYQFAVVFINVTDKTRPAVTFIKTPKTGAPTCQYYGDICYSMSSNRPWFYYLLGGLPWNIILGSSSNSMEIATLGSSDDMNTWCQWFQPDDARPELPLTDKKIENFPVGLSIDTCGIHQIQWDENTLLPHMPLLHVVSQTGLLTIFNIVNLNKQAAPICTAPQQLTLPAAAMSSVVPGQAAQAPTPAAPPAPTPIAQPKPVQPAPVSAPQPQPQTVQQPQQFGGLNIPKPSFSTSFSSSFSTNFDQKPAAAEQKPTPVQPTPQPVMAQAQPVAPKPLPPQVQENAALKAEQEKINEMKANQELKNMLVKEVNDFQMELYKFCVKTRETQAKLQQDIDSINANFNYTSQDAQQLRKECSSEEIRGAIVQLKLELVRACAVIAEARTHAEAKEYHQWTQADPLTTKRVASVKKLAYYVQTQLEQAQKALDYKWNEALSRDNNLNKPGHRMIRPILDEVYQPLVKQQEILSRQQAVLRTLRNTLNECDVTPMFKTTSLLRSTPFKNKDPLSKLTKNILNMSLDTTDNKKKEPLLSSQKLDALRDMLSNHKTVKIKPVNVEMRQHLATMRINYEKSLKEKVQAQAVKTEPDVKPEVKLEDKPSPIITPKAEPFASAAPYKPQVMPTPPPVARTLFPQTKQEPVQKPQAQVPQPKPAAPAFAFSSTPAPAETRSVLKDLLQNKQAAKNDANTFMGQNICSPSSFAFSPTTTTATKTTPTSPPSVFTAKPISDINNMFNKFQPQAFGQEPKPQAIVPEPKQLFEPKPATAQPSPTVVPSSKPQPFSVEPKQQTSIFSTPKSSETGEPEDSKGVATKKVDKLTNLFAMKTSTPISSPVVPDVLKATQEVKTDKDKPAEKEKAKENVPEKVEPKVVQKPAIDSKELSVSFTIQTPNKSSVFGSTSQAASSASARPLSPTKPLEGKPSAKSETAAVSEKPDTSSTSTAASIFGTSTASPATATATKSEEKTEPTPSKAESTTSETTESSASKSSLFSSPTPSAASVFGTAAASPSKPSSPAASIFASAVSSSSSTSVFGSSSQGSIFGSTSPTKTTASVFGSTAQSVFSGAGNVTKPSVFSTPTPSSPTPSSPTSGFGTTPTTTQAGSIFSSSFAQPSVFASTTTAASPTSVFGSSTTSSVFGTSPTTRASVFGASTTTTASVFGSTTAKTQASVFGSAPASTASAFTSATTPASGAQSIFASAAANTTKPPLFGGTGSPVVFGSQASSNQTSVFGTVTTQASVFGSSTATTQSSVFGSPIATSQASVFGSVPTSQASVFGSAPTTQASVFGAQPTTTAQSSSLFGGAEANLFASASISTTSAPSPTSGGSIFGGSSGSVFGGGSTNVFGGKAAFGQPNPTAAAIFGGGGATAFGQQKPANNFWSGGNNTEGGFGSTGFGQQPTTQASSIFGGTTGGSFSTPSPAGQAFGSPQQPAFGSGDNNTSVFGSPQQQSASPAFGGSPVFGSKPVFGQPSGFGSPPSGGFGSSFGGFNKSPSGFGAPAAFGGGATFGGGAAFGGSSPGKVFGGAAPAPSFGAPTQSNATFENLATQNTLTFGNLAQQSAQPQPQQPSFNTSPSFKAWRG
ncbi:nuclear pore complex protein Nup214 [Trichoplusia ni]|uniref:Nuclear pore complex protein Nup214 n=1 Tax=Trichoplusia ni TaxID=7111 RepID=A0A7E5V9H4_TRINI|nr:nuclear pore complex protein Nup214 [Trichoplusia ni]